MKTIVIVVAPTGEAKVETNGFSGAECQTASRFLEDVLGKKKSEHLSGEYYATTSETNSQTQQEG